MWIFKVIFLACAFGVLDSYAGPKNYGLKVYKHVITVSDISHENPLPKPGPKEEDEMAAKF